MTMIFEKASFFEKKTFNQCFGANLKIRFFAKFYTKFVTLFSFLAQKMLKMKISTGICVQHPKAGRNIQHPKKTKILTRIMKETIWQREKRAIVTQTF